MILYHITYIKIILFDEKRWESQFTHHQWIFWLGSKNCGKRVIQPWMNLNVSDRKDRKLTSLKAVKSLEVSTPLNTSQVFFERMGIGYLLHESPREPTVTCSKKKVFFTSHREIGGIPSHILKSAVTKNPGCLGYIYTNYSRWSIFIQFSPIPLRGRFPTQLDSLTLR